MVLLHGVLVAAGAFSGVRAPIRAAALYTGRADAADAVFPLMMAPLQAVVAVLMLMTSHALTTKEIATRMHAAVALLLFALMELGFAAVRFRVNALSGVRPWWRLPARGPVVSVAACAVSVLFAAVYLTGWRAIVAHH